MPRRAWPHAIKPVFARPLAGEGSWKPTGPPVDGGPPVLITTFRTELNYPRIVHRVAWFDHTRTALALYPGPLRATKSLSAGRRWSGFRQDQRWRLLATFNGGFTYIDGQNGSAVNGHSNEPLRDGLATLVGYRNGRWTSRLEMRSERRPQIVFARQSLPLIIEDGKLSPALNDRPKWGDARKCRPRLADRRRHRPARQRALRRR